MSKFIISTYAISGGLIYASNNYSYQPGNRIFKGYWNMLKLNTDVGQKCAGLFLIFSPFLVPVFTLTIPGLYIIDKLVSRKY